MSRHVCETCGLEYEYDIRTAPETGNVVYCGACVAPWLRSQRLSAARSRASRKRSVAVRKAIDAGRIVRSENCERCGASGRIEGHHWSYADEHVLDVEWLCVSCHRKHHWDHGPAKNDPLPLSRAVRNQTSGPVDLIPKDMPTGNEAA